MPRKLDAEVVTQVSAYIESAITANRQSERIVVLLLLILFLVGLGLLVLGAVMERWLLLLPGGIVQITIVVPLRALIKLREDNVRLQVLPQLIRLADTKQAKILAARLVKRLIAKV